MIAVTLHYWPQNLLQRILLLQRIGFAMNRPASLTRHLPQSWDELNASQLRSLARAHFMLQGEVAKQLYLCYHFLRLPFWLFLRIDRQDLQQVYRHFSQLMGDNRLAKTVIPSVRVGLDTWYGPDDFAKNMSFLEFIKADTAYSAFITSGDTSHINQLVAVLYRPSRTDVFESSLDFKGDERIPLNEYHLASRSREARRIKLVDRFAILLQYAGLRRWLQERYPETFCDGKPSKFGWAGVIVSLAGEKFGDDDAVASKNIHAILTHLEMTLTLRNNS